MLRQVPDLHAMDESEQSAQALALAHVSRAGDTHQKSLPPLTAWVLPARTATVITISSCSYLQNLLTMRVSFSSSSHSSTAPGGEVGGHAPRLGRAPTSAGEPRGGSPLLTGVGGHQNAPVSHPAQVGHSGLGLHAGGAEALAGGATGVGEDPEGAGPAAPVQPRGAQQQGPVCRRGKGRGPVNARRRSSRGAGRPGPHTAPTSPTPLPFPPRTGGPPAAALPAR